MDALQRADQVLARARARRADIVTPDSAISPMDQTNTVQIPRVMVVAADPRTANPDVDPVDTIIPAAVFGRGSPRTAASVPPVHPAEDQRTPAIVRAPR
ncbi:MAG: hypothetical protein ACRDSZ_12730 [Pseudonocardiaceae bacterium]